jgi:hypothetical protein
MAFAVLVEALNLAYAARKAKRDQQRASAVKLRPTYPDVDESVAVAAALSATPESGSVGLSRKPIAGEIAADDERTGLG